MLILASQSPSRAMLLRGIGIPFHAHPADIDESPIPKERPTAYVKRVAREKAEKVSNIYPDAPILAADTVVVVGARILRKAETQQEASDQIDILSGRRHRVYTALALRLPSGEYHTRLCMTHVAVKVLEAHEKQHFLRSGEWKQVAVYRVEGVMSLYIRMMRGLVSNIQGLPVWDVYSLLKGHGLLAETGLVDHSKISGHA